MVKSALRMLALYMYFNGTGIWGGETLWLLGGLHSYMEADPVRYLKCTRPLSLWPSHRRHLVSYTVLVDNITAKQDVEPMLF